MAYMLTFIALVAVTTSLAVPVTPPLPNLQSRQTPTLREGSWFITWTPSFPNSQVYRGPLRITSDASATYISGDLYNGTIQPNPADGSPILPRENYWAYVRPTQLTIRSNGGFSLALEFWQLLNFQHTLMANATVWDDVPYEGGFNVDMSSAT